MQTTEQWFIEQVLPLEGELTRYLLRVLSDKAEVEDLRQEVYVRIYESGTIRQRPATRYFVFAVARNLLIDRLRRQRVVTIDSFANLESLHLRSDEVPADRVLSGRQELARLETALNDLPPKCRAVFGLRKIEGLSQREAARRLGVTESTIEKQTGKAMRLLADSFLGANAEPAPASLPPLGARAR
jgi:RNA polymerase sigma factor (sigma-70 family)